MESQIKEEEAKKRKNKKRWLLLLLLLLLIGITSCMMHANRYVPSAPIISADLLPALRDAQDRTLEEVAQEWADANYFTLIINPLVTFPDGSSPGNIGVINENAYAIAVNYYLEETGELIYSTGGILPGQFVYGAALDVPLPAGEHQVLARINIYDAQTHEFLWTTQAQVQFMVEN